MKENFLEDAKTKSPSNYTNSSEKEEGSSGLALSPPPFNPVIQKQDDESKKWVQSSQGWSQVDKSSIKKSKQWQKVDGKWVQTEKPKLAPIKLPEKYKDEEKKVGWRARKGSPSAEKTSRVTKHFSEDEFEKDIRLTEENNSLSTSEGYNHMGKNVYAMNPEGQLGINSTGRNVYFEGDQRQDVHHSSIFSGGDVMHAGHMGLNTGKVSYLDDDSGHYKPGEKHTYHAYKNLKKRGLLAEKGKVAMVDKTIENKADPRWHDNQLSLPFSSYEQTKGNEQQARNKEAMLEQLDKTHKAPEEGNLVPVPFKPGHFQSGGSDPSYGTVDPNPVPNNVDHGHREEESSHDPRFYSDNNGKPYDFLYPPKDQSSEYSSPIDDPHPGFYPNYKKEEYDQLYQPEDAQEINQESETGDQNSNEKQKSPYLQYDLYAGNGNFYGGQKSYYDEID